MSRACGRTGCTISETRSKMPRTSRVSAIAGRSLSMASSRRRLAGPRDSTVARARATGSGCRRSPGRLFVAAPGRRAGRVEVNHTWPASRRPPISGEQSSGAPHRIEDFWRSRRTAGSSSRAASSKRWVLPGSGRIGGGEVVEAARSWDRLPSSMPATAYLRRRSGALEAAHPHRLERQTARGGLGHLHEDLASARASPRRCARCGRARPGVDRRRRPASGLLRR